jgi:hypothetical protein
LLFVRSLKVLRRPLIESFPRLPPPAQQRQRAQEDFEAHESLVEAQAGPSARTLALVSGVKGAVAFGDIRNEVLGQLAELVSESEIVYRELVLPNWGRKTGTDSPEPCMAM